VPVVVTGLRELNRAFQNTDRDTRLGWRAEMRQVAEPVRRDAEQRAISAIPRMPWSPRWARMRVGVTRQMVYVAPRQRGVRWNKKNPGYRFEQRRPNLGNLLMDRALIPAGEAHEHQTEMQLERLMDRVAAGFNGYG